MHKKECYGHYTLTWLWVWSFWGAPYCSGPSRLCGSAEICSNPILLCGSQNCCSRWLYLRIAVCHVFLALYRLQFCLKKPFRLSTVSTTAPFRTILSRLLVRIMWLNYLEPCYRKYWRKDAEWLRGFHDGIISSVPNKLWFFRACSEVRASWIVKQNKLRLSLKSSEKAWFLLSHGDVEIPHARSMAEWTLTKTMF